MSVEIEIEGAKELQELIELSPKAARLAHRDAANRALTHAQKKISKGIQITYFDTALIRDIKRKFNFDKATYRNMDASLDFEGTRLKLSDVEHSQATRKSRVMVRIKGSSKPLPNNFFIAKSKARGDEVWKRNPRGSKHKIGYGFTIAYPQMVEQVYDDDLHEETIEWYQKRFEKQFRWRTEVKGQD